MAKQKPDKTLPPTLQVEGITRITVGGFKSIVQEQSIEIRPLTVLAGTNSSGKSSIMQLLLLLKQTLEAPYDPGALLLNGPNVRFTAVEQFLSRTDNKSSAWQFHIGVETNYTNTITTQFSAEKKRKLHKEQMLYSLGIQTLVAEGKLPPELVKLHWFSQQEDGSTQIASADLDKTGAFGDWPEDFDDVELYSEKRYLDAAQARLRGK